ncbi:response regulator transcription factor [Paenibacillus beijingensis]|uniref:Chemotaxis protein CheY n=1 Tax=Paenibacillus beijingensis TaxID=1126833 RepID=A0A0D5NGI4_9BACL|nr:helix-turn-helix domain-containing protein [Paenibacillus beijingensis]AJY74225.1 chemotaxis protein CheY [Paenibacillus beijingensis]
MYRVMIADDEALEREGLEWIVRNMMPGEFEIIHAENGRIAIERAEEHHPQIVLMDVNMPGIRGLDAIREIKSRLPDTKFVLVTAYDYFSYAQEALSLGVKEYIVKPAKRTHVVETLKRLVEELDSERSKRTEELELRHTVSRLIPLAENELALMIMVHQIVDADAGQLAEWLDFPLDGGCAVVVAFPKDVYTRDKKKIYDSVRSFAKTSGPDCIVSSLIDRHMAIFLRTPPAAAGEVWKQETIRYGEELISRAKRQLDMTLFVGIGSAQSGTEGLHQSYFEAVFASTYFEHGGKACHFDDLKKGSGVPLPVPGEGSLNESALHRSYVVSALQRNREEREQQTLTVLDRAKSYIQERFTEDISLEEVAEYVHLNPFYLSKILKQQIGETFIDLVTRLRIEKAKALMASESLSLKEVCFEVGYKDPNYFSRVFKRVTGITPSEYRGQAK